MGQKQRGFTLIELMVTIAVLAIVVSIAAPSFSTMINNNRSVALGEELASAINFARVEAAKRGDTVSICASSDGSSCSNDWTQGWIVLTDNNSGSTAPAGNVLRIWEAPDGGATIAVDRDGTATGFLRFVRLGTTEPSGTVTFASSVDGCASGAARTITVGPAGLVNIARSDCS